MEDWGLVGFGFVVAAALVAVVLGISTLVARDSWHSDDLKNKSFITCVQAGNKPAECKGAMP